MKRYRLFSMIFIIALVFPRAQAQNSQTMYYMNLPQNHLLNPAIQPVSKVYIGLPAISGVNVDFSNNLNPGQVILSIRTKL